MENDLKEILIVSTLSWFVSTMLSLAVLSIYWDIIGIKNWTIELTLIACWNFGILGIIVAAILISIFLHRFKIIRKT